MSARDVAILAGVMTQAFEMRRAGEFTERRAMDTQTEESRKRAIESAEKKRIRKRAKFLKIAATEAPHD